MPHFIFIQQISVLNILNMLYNLHFFSSKCRLFHNATLFGSCITHILNATLFGFCITHILNATLFGFCITHILNTGCAKIWKKIRRQKVNVEWTSRFCSNRVVHTHRLRI